MNKLYSFGLIQFMNVANQIIESTIWCQGIFADLHVEAKPECTCKHVITLSLIL